MPRNLYVLFSEREGSKIEKIRNDLNLQEIFYKKLELNFNQYDKQVNTAIEKINQSNLEDDTKKAIISSIENLEQELIKETDNSLMLKKYAQLANMLEKLVINTHTTIEDKTHALELFLTAFNTPSSLLTDKIKLAQGITIFALVVAIAIAAYFLVPLIPFGIAFGLLGLSGTALIFATSFSSVLTQFGAVLLTSMIFEKISEKLYNPLANFFQKFSEEAKEASVLNEHLRQNFFVPLPPVKAFDIEENQVNLFFSAAESS